MDRRLSTYKGCLVPEGDLKTLAAKDYILDDDLIDLVLRDRLPQLRIYRPDEVTIVLGRGSKPGIELNLDVCEADHANISRRRGGGCAVVLDPGDIIVSLALPASGFGKIREHFEAISNWLIDGLERAGIKGVHREGTSDLVIDDRKIAGASMQRKRDLVFYSCSILVCPRVDLMERWLGHPPREPEYRHHRTHSDFVGSLASQRGAEDIDALAEKMRSLLRADALRDI